MNSAPPPSKPLPWTFRDATLDDLPAMVEIYNSIIPSRLVTADLEPVSVAQRRPWFDQHSPGRRPIWVAETAGRIAGWLSYSSFHSRAAYDGTCEVSIYLGPADRGCGLGSELLRRCIAHAPSLQCHSLVALIFAANRPSLRLFERHGFTTWGHLPRVALVGDREQDLVILGRRVG